MDILEKYDNSPVRRRDRLSGLRVADLLRKGGMQLRCRRSLIRGSKKTGNSIPGSTKSFTLTA